MSNQRKPRFGKHRATSRKKRRELQEKGPAIEQFGMMNLNMPESEDVIAIKEVPAMHTGFSGGDHEGEKVRVGIAIIHDNGEVALRYDEDAPLWAMSEIQGFADSVGYSLETGGPVNGPS